ncbi:C40 family peptidase [Arthrobacter monumenti]
MEYAYAGLGRPYVWGGTSFISGWDCSGFVQWAYRHAGIELPRVSQWAVLEPTTTPSPGDLVAQRPDGPNHWAHVGIYVGNGMMISALNPDEGTVLHSVGPEGSSWFFTTSVSGGADAPSGLVAGGPLTDYQAPAMAPSPAEVPSGASSGDARQDSTTKDKGKRRIETATLSRVKVPATGEAKNTSKMSKTPETNKADERAKAERDKADERDKSERRAKTERDIPARGEKTREQDEPAEGEEETRPEKPRQETPSDEESPKADNSTGKDTAGNDATGKDKTGKDKTGKDTTGNNATGKDKTGPKEIPEPETEDTTGADKTAEPGEAAESTGTPENPEAENSADPSSTQEEDESPEPVNGTGTSEETGEASPEQSVVPEEAEGTEGTEGTEDPAVPQGPASDSGDLQVAVVALAMAQVGQEHDAVSFIETVLTGAGYAPATSGRDYLQLGETVTIETAAAGDLLYCTDASGQTFAAIYLGEGLAVRGGGEGGQAVEFSLSEMTTSPVVIRLASQL